DFQSLLTDGQASQCVKLVVQLLDVSLLCRADEVLNACHSFAVGQHFVQAGVKHVVCVQDDKEVRDNSCRLFARNFFSALRAGRSIGESFGCGVASLRHSSDVMCQKDAGSFVLLPEGGDHNVVLAGVAATLPSSASPRWLPARVEDFMGREVDIWRLLCHLKSRRLVTLSGSKGIGKTALMVAAGRFVQMRRGDSFQDGFQEVWLGCDIPSKISQSLQDLLRALQELQARASLIDDPSILVLADVPSVSSNNLPLKQLLEANAKVRLVLEVADASPSLKDQLGSLNVKPTKMELGPLQPLAQVPPGTVELVLEQGQQQAPWVETRSARIPVESSEQLANVPGQSRSAHLRKLVSQYADAEDFYALFNLRRYSEITKVETRKISLRFHELMLQWHPDKNPPARKAECEIMTVKIQYARKVLLDPDLKRRYDRELHKQAGTWSYWDWYLRWGINVVFIVGGAALTFGGGVAALQTGGLSLAAAIAGSSLFMAGVKGSVAMWRDEDCSWTEYTKELGVGALAGLAEGAISAAGAGAIAGCAGAGACIAAAGIGASTTAVAKLISDGVDVAVTKGWLGESVRKNITNSKTSEDVFCIANAKQLAQTTAIGAVAGFAAQGVATHMANAAKSSNLVDDFANAVSAGVKGQDPNKLAGLLPENLVPRLLGNVAGASADVARGTSFAERIRIAAPDVQNMLVTRAEEADFILSRTNLQKDFADKIAVAVMREGFKLCADNSLQGGWGGPDWVLQYARDAKKTRFGILVLEGGHDFFHSAPCCSELYTAKRADVNLTKVHGTSIKRGEYLWVILTEEARLFLCRAARPLYDFELAGEPGANVPSTPPKIAEGFGQALGDLMVLAELPWMRDFEGNPSRIVDAAQALS
ncbi:unnamed protein product, partial [Symbiodinium necroappetens]